MTSWGHRIDPLPAGEYRRDWTCAARVRIDGERHAHCGRRVEFCYTYRSDQRGRPLTYVQMLCPEHAERLRNRLAQQQETGHVTSTI